MTCTDNVVTFDPDADFSKDMTIKVKIDDGIRSLKKIGMNRAFEWSFFTGVYVDKTPPVASGNPSAESVRSTGFEIRWPVATDNVTPSEEMDYLVYIGALPTDLGTVTPVTVHGHCQYSVQGLNPSTTRYFMVKAVDAAGNITPYSQYSSGTTNARHPFVVTDGEVHATALSGNTLYFGGLFNYAGTPVQNIAVIDTVTGQKSTKVTSPQVNGSVNVAVSDGVGGWYIGGSFTSVNGVTRNRIARINPDGSVHEFNPNCSGQVTAIVVSSDEKYVYFSGNFNKVGGEDHICIAKVSAYSGKTITGWGTELSTYAEVLKISGNYLYMGGGFTTVNGSSASRLARVNLSDGLLDQTWLPNPDGYVLCLDINGSTLYAGGSFNSIGSKARNNAAEIRLSDGTATDWNPSPDGTVFDILFDIYFDSDYVFLGGTFKNVGSVICSHIARVSNSTGIAEASWGTDADGSSKVMCFELFAGGLYIGGKFTSMNGKVQNNTSCVMKNGSVDSTWVSSFDKNGGVESIAANSDGSAILVCGSISALMTPRPNAAAYNFSTGELTDWNPKTNGMVKAIAIGNGAVYIGGSFTEAGYDAASAHLAKTNPNDGTIEADVGGKWSADGDVNVLLTNPAGTSIFIGGPFTKIKSAGVSNAEGYELSSGNGLGGWHNYLTASNMDDVNSLVWFNPSSSVFVGGKFDYQIVSPSVRIENFGKCSSYGTLNTGYDTNVPGIVQAACTDNNDTIFVAGSGYINSYSASSAAAGWSKSLSSSDKDVFAMQYLSGKLYAGGNFSFTGSGITRNHLLRFDLMQAGEPLDNWGPVFDQAGVYTISAGADMIVVGGTFNTVDGKSHKGIAAIDITTGKAWE